MNEERALKSLVTFHERQLTRIAADLRKLADEVEQEIGRTSSSYVDRATWVIHDIMNVLPNLPLSILVQAARDRDIFQRS